MHIVTFITSLRSPEARKDKRDKPLSTNTLLNICKALKSILDSAHECRLIAKNPIDGVSRPKADKKELKSRKKSYTKTRLPP